MKTNQNKPLPNEVAGLNKSSITPDTSEPKAQEFSALNPLEGESITDPVTDPPTKKKAGQHNNSSSTSIKGKPLDNLGKFVQGQIESGNKKLINIDLEEYSKYFGGNIGYVEDKKTLDQDRAYAQGAVEQFKHASARIGLNIIPEVISQIANVVDIEDYFNSDQEVGNWLSTEMKKLQEQNNEANPIYRENPEETLNVSDSGWWFENGSSLVTSAAGFVATGYITGAAALKTVTAGAKWAKGLSAVGALTSAEQKGVRALSALTSAVALNQAEGVGIGVDTFKISYDREVEKIKADPKNIELSEQDIDKQARQVAAKDATSAINFNKMNILLNLTSASMFLKSPVNTRTLLTAPSFKKTLGVIGLEGAQEYAEENINDISRDRALDKAYRFKDAMSYVLSEEGFEAGFLGFIGGAGQTALTKAGKAIPMHKNIEFDRAYANEYSKLDTDISEEERTATATRIALEKVGSSKKYVSANSLENRRYLDQQEAMFNYNTLSQSEKVGDVINTFYSATEQVQLLEEINKAQEEGNQGLQQQLESKLFSNQVHNAFQLGTTESLIELYQGYANLTKEEAEQKGLPTGELDYKELAKNAIVKIKALETKYNDSLSYVNSNEVYFAEAQHMSIEEEIEKNKKHISDLVAASEQLYKNDPDKHPGKEGNYNDIDSSTGYNFMKVSAGFKTTPLYERLKELSRADYIMTSAKKEIRDHIDSITTKEYQKELQSAIKKNKEARKLEQLKAFAKETTASARKTINDTVSRIRNSQEDDDVEDEIETEDNTADVVEPDTDVNTTGEEQEQEEEEETTPTPKKGTFSKTPFFLEIPVFKEKMINDNFNHIKAVVESPRVSLEDSIKLVSYHVDNFKANKTEIAMSLPGEENKLEELITNLSNVLSDLEGELQDVNSSKAELQKEQADFIRDLADDLDEENDNENVIEDAAPTTPNFAKAQQRVNKLVRILEKLEATGLDTSNFKAVVKSFEDSTSKDEVLEVFNTLKALYNAATGFNLEGTYEELIYSKEKKSKVIAQHEKILEYHPEKDAYSNIHDNISQEVLAIYRDLAALSNLRTTDTGFAFSKFNETASNKLAYLSKQYREVLTAKVSGSGNEYIEVSKEDINNMLNDTLAQQVLDPDFLAAGKEIEFVPLTSITLENGDILNAEDTTVDNAPIGIRVDGEIVDGLYLHDVGWLNTSNLSGNKAMIEKDQKTLRNFRQRILDAKSPLKSVIISRSPGVPILDSSGALSNVLSSMPNVEIGISRGGKIYSQRDKTISVINKTKVPEGKNVIVIPFGDSKLALAVKRTQLQKDAIESIVTAVSVHLEGKNTPLTKKLEADFGYNIISTKGLEAYLANFLHLSSLDASSFSDFKLELNTIPDNLKIIQFSKGELVYGTGQGIEVNNIRKNKNNGEERAKDIAHLGQFLTGLYSNITLDKLKENKQFPYIIKGEIKTPYESYNEYAKAQLLSPFLSIKLESGKEIYTIQSRIHFDMEGSMEASKEISKKDQAVLDKLVEDGSTVSNSANSANSSTKGKQVTMEFPGEVAEENTEENTDNFSDVMELPNGDTFSFDDVTEDESPMLASEQNPPREFTLELRALKTLKSDKAQSIFDKGKKNNWTREKILTELQIPKSLISYLTRLPFTTRESMIKQLHILTRPIISVSNVIATEEELDAHYSAYDVLSHYNRVDETLRENYFGIGKSFIKPKKQFNVTDIDGTLLFDEGFDTQEEADKARKDLIDSEKNKILSNYYSEYGILGGKDYRVLSIHMGKIVHGYRKHLAGDGNEVAFARVDNSNITEKTLRVIGLQSDFFTDSDLNNALSRSKHPFIKHFFSLLKEKQSWIYVLHQALIKSAIDEGYEYILLPTEQTLMNIEDNPELAVYQTYYNSAYKKLQQNFDFSNYTDLFGNSWFKVDLRNTSNFEVLASPELSEENLIDNLLDSANLIKGVGLSTQSSLIQSITTDIYTQLINQRDIENVTVELKPAIDLQMQGLEMIASKAEKINHPKKEYIREQVDRILANRNKIAQGVALQLGKRMNLSKSDTNQSADEFNILDAEDNNTERSMLSDTLQYAIDPKTTLTGRVKDFLFGVKDKKVVQSEDTIKYVNKTTLLNLNKYISPDVVFNDLLSILGNSNTNLNYVSPDIVSHTKYGKHPSYVINALTKLEEALDTKPYLIDVINRLKSAELSVQNGLILAVNKWHTNHIYVNTLYNTNSKTRSLLINKSARRSLDNYIIAEWQTNLKLSRILTEEEGKPVINTEVLKEFNKTFLSLKQTIDGNSPQKVVDWLSTIGVEVPIQLIQDIEEKGIPDVDVVLHLQDMFTLSKGIFNNIHKRVNRFNPELENGYSIEEYNLYEDNSFKYLANISKKYRANIFTNSYKNGKGDTIYGFTNNRYAISRFGRIKTDTNLLTDLKNDAFSRHSTWLNDMFINGEINQESLVHQYLEYATSDSLKTSQTMGKLVENLDEQGLAKYHLALFFNRGLAVGKTNPTPIMRTLYFTMSDKANTFIFQHPGEYVRLDTKGKVPNSVKEKLVEQLIFPEAERILKFQREGNIVNIAEYSKGAGSFLLLPVMNSVEEFWQDGKLKEDILSNAEYLPKMKRVVTEMLSEEVKQVTEEWKDANILLTNKDGEVTMPYIDANYAKVFAPTSYVETVVNYVVNTVIANMNYQQLFVGDPVLFYKGRGTALESAIATSDNIGKRLAMDNAGKDEFLHEPNETMNVWVVKDNLVTTSNHAYITKMFGEEFAKDYTNVNSTDAQEYTTLKEYLFNRVRENKMSKEAANTVLDLHDRTGKIPQYVTDSIEKIMLNPDKPVYGNNFQRDGIHSRLYIKSSSFPLIKEFTVGTPLDVIRKHMEKHDINRLAYESAVKVGQPIELSSIHQGDEINIPTDWEKSLIRDIPRQGHGIQQDVPYSPNKNDVNDGTQQSKLLFTNLLEVAGFIHPITKEKVMGRDISDLYHSTYNELFKTKYEELKKSLQVVNGTVTNVKKLKRLLVDEGMARNYALNDLAAFELDEVVDKFTVPLWLNTSDSKIGALLNSIVDNRVRKRKFRGKSFVLGSSSGVNLTTLNETNKNKIIKVGDWDGKLKGAVDKDGNMTYSEIIIPFKFWDNSGKLLKIDQFLNKDNTLDTTKIPEELLEIFGYRIPTSGVNLISTIKVVGFLPANYGDIVIAPSEFIVQMGSDFDVDKLYSHMYNTFLTEEGILERIQDFHVQEINTIQDRIRNMRRSSKEEKKSEEEILVLTDKINELRQHPYLVIEDAQEKVLQNRLVDIHKAVLNNPAKEVQYARNRPIGFGMLPELVDLVEDKGDQTNFSILRNTYQRRKYSSARSGKTAVGTFSLDVVLNTSLQYVKTPLYFVGTNAEGKPFNISYTIAGQTSTALNHTTTSTGRFKSEVIEAFMTAALDNESQQYLSKLGVNDITFDFIRAMNQLGFEEDITVLIMNQPSIKEYVKEKLNYKTIELPERTLQDRSLLASLSTEKLKEGLETRLSDNVENALLLFFTDMIGRGKELKTVQGAINSDSAGIGKDIFYSDKKADDIIELYSSTSITGIHEIIGDYIYAGTITDSKKNTELLEAGYIRYKDMFIKPNSINGFASVYATLLNAEIWKEHMPYTSPDFSQIILPVLYGQPLSDPTKKHDYIEAQKEVVSNYKSFLTSSTYRLFSDYTSAQEARTDLLFDTLQHKSLGTIIQELKSTGVYTNALLDRLQAGKTNTVTDLTGKIPTDITYSNTFTLDLDEEQMLHSFIDMITLDKDLGEINGQKWTTRTLADKLITHQIVTRGVQKAGQIFNYIPFTYLKSKGFYSTLEVEHANTVKGEDKSLLHRFQIQMIQHYPEKYVSDSKIQDLLRSVEVVDNEIRLLEDSSVQYPIAVLPHRGSYLIGVYDGYKYVKVDVLGQDGLKEFDSESSYAKSSIYVNQKTPLSEATTIKSTPLPNADNVSDFLSNDKIEEDNSPLLYNTEASDLVTKYFLSDANLSVADRYRMILNNIQTESTNPVMKHFAGKISSVAEYLSDTPLIIDTRMQAKGRAYTTKIFGRPLEIRINPNLIKSEKDMQDVLMEEIIHATLKKDLNENPHSPINKLYEEVKQVAIAKYGQNAFDTMAEKIKNRKPLQPGVERNIMYNLLNVDEFVAAAIKDETFQKFLSSTEATYITKSLWEKFISAIREVLNKIGVRKDSNLEAVLHEVYNKFDKRNLSIYSDLTVPTYTRSITFLNKKFDLVDNSSTPIIKGNAKEIANFINKHIVNVEAKEIKGKVILRSTTLDLYSISESPELEVNTDGIGPNLIQYIQSLKIRVKNLNNIVKRARINKDLTKVAELEEVLEEEKLKLETVKEITSLVELVSKAKEDLDLVATMLKRPLTAEDIIYIRGTVNFWKNAKEQIFDTKAYSSDSLTELYGGIEGLAEKLSMQLFKIEKTYLEKQVKKYLNKDVDINKMFSEYKDINFLQGNVRDISTYDNELLNTIWTAVKTANIDAQDEGNRLLEGLEQDLTSVIPALKALGNSEIFEIFRQKTNNGKYTNHLITPYTHTYYKEKRGVLKTLYNDNNRANLIAYTNWLTTNTKEIDLQEYFPDTKTVTKEVQDKRNQLKSEIGEGKYKYWEAEQTRLLNIYDDKKAGYINKLMGDFNLNDATEIHNNPEALKSFNFWVEKNSPYLFTKAAYGKGKFINTRNFSNYIYFTPIPINKAYLDTNFDTISNNPTLLNFYLKVDNILEELKQYVPEEQQKTLAYGGLPAIEKSLYELYAEKGSSLGFSPIYETFIKSMQTSYSDTSVSTVDPVTGKPDREMRIPIIKNNSKAIQEAVDKAILDYTVANKKEPTAKQIEEFRENAIDDIARSNTFDLGKLIKVYSSLVLAHKHKHKLEDMIKIANTILDGYKETQLRPDGSPVTDYVTGVVQKKDSSASFLKTKDALDAYVRNVIYGDIKEEEGKGKKSYTPSEKARKKELDNKLLDILEQKNLGEIDENFYQVTKDKIEVEQDRLGKTFIYSKAGDNVLKYIQLKLMGWNVLGGVSNMGFGYISNQLEASGGQLFNTKDLNYAYKLTMNSVLKNNTFNKVETDIAKKIRLAMNKWDVLKDASHELYASSTPNSFGKSTRWLSPYNMNQRTEYVNQAPLLIALARNTKVTTDKGEISIWDGYDNNWEWNSEYGTEPKEVITKLRIKIDQMIKRTHGNYDTLSPLAAKRVFLGRAVSQLRTWLYESVAVRVEKERFDDALGIAVKGRYRSVGTVFSNSNFAGLALESLKSLLKNYTFGLVSKSADFDSLVDNENIKEVDAANMRKVIKEVSLAINTYLFLLLLSALRGDDDEGKIANILFNQGTRLKTDLLLYVNPMEARNILRDIIPAMALVKDTTDWLSSVGGFLGGKDEISSGVHSGDSKLGASSVKMLPFGAKAYSLYNSASQSYDK